MPGAAIGDLDLEYFKSTYLRHAIAPDELDRNERATEQQLRSLCMLVGQEPTYGAVLAIGRDPRLWIPGAYLQFLRIGGTEITDPILHQRVLEGRLEDILHEIDVLLDINISVRTEVATTHRELRVPDYPIAALQQLVRNAVMHRRYEGTNAPVRLYWYSDRIEISSPGGLYGQVTPENFGTGVADYRNPLVAEIMRNLGYAQRSGLG